MTRAALIFALREGPPDLCMHTEQFKEIGLGTNQGDAFRPFFSTDTIAGGPRKEAHGGKRSVLRTPIRVVLAGERIGTGRSFRFPQRYDLPGFAKWQRLEEDSIDNGEDGGVRANSQREGQDSYGREARIFRERSKRVVQILPEVYEPVCFAHRFSFSWSM